MDTFGVEPSLIFPKFLSLLAIDLVLDLWKQMTKYNMDEL
jgi:hypothetical protein